VTLHEHQSWDPAIPDIDASVDRVMVFYAGSSDNRKHPKAELGLGNSSSKNEGDDAMMSDAAPSASGSKWP